MYKILEKKDIGPNLVYMKIEATRVANKAMPGQFIILRAIERGERIPLTIADFNREEGWVAIIFQVVGNTTKILSQMEAGESIKDFVGPLGKQSELKGLKKVLCIGGGVGVAPLYPQVKFLHQNGADVDVIIGAKTKEFLILEKEMKDISNNLHVATDDGSYGHKGFVSDILVDLIEKGNEYDEVIAIGPLIMMKVVANITKKYNIKTTVSMNPIMVDGTGMCGGCRVTVGGKTYYACVDGPDFDGHQVDFDQAMRRQQMYKDEEHDCKLDRGDK